MKQKQLILIAIIGLVIGSLFAFNATESQENTTQHDGHDSHEIHESKEMKNHAQMSEHDTIKVLNFKASLTHYFALQKALSDDHLKRSKDALKDLKKNIGDHSKVAPIVLDMLDSQSLEEIRASFEPLSLMIGRLIQHHGTPKGMVIKKYRCSMAHNNKGAMWLQDYDGLRNPYFGASMLTCGVELNQGAK